MPDTPKHLLLVEDEAPLREAVAERLGGSRVRCRAGRHGERALEALAEFAFDIVVTDLRLPGIDGDAGHRGRRRALPRHHRHRRHRLRHRERRGGGHQARRRPTSSPSRSSSTSCCTRCNAALEQRRLQVRERVPASAAPAALSASRASSAAAARCATCSSCSRRWRATASTILITGETGTGKEVVARAIHHNSPRRAQRFVAHQLQRDSRDAARGRAVRPRARGVHRRDRQRARDGSSRRTAARCSSTRSGTMSMALQMKLLRVLQEREFERVGDSQTIKVDVRVIAATNADLRADGRRGHVPRGPLLPAERDPRAAAAAARAQGRHPAARAALPPEVLRRAGTARR